MSQFDQRGQHVGRDQYNAGRDQYNYVNPFPQDPNKKRLLESVRQNWIEGVLEPSLYNDIFIALALREEPDMVRQAVPWDSIVAQRPRPPLTLFPGVSIDQVYDQSSGELLILGEPGSGKTTLLLQLTRILLDRATRGKELFIPVVFHLSSWARQQLPIANWLGDELYKRYRVRKKLAQSWIDSDQIVPLLDGLDEVAPNLREKCAEEINNYHKEHGVPIVVSSRKADYQALKTKLFLNHAIYIEPLTEQQAQDYLSNAKGLQEAIGVYLLKDNRFKELLTTPLMLGVITEAFRGKPVEDLIDLLMSQSQRGIRDRVFETYVKSMFERRERAIRHNSPKVKRQLSWLAREMSRRDLTLFSSDLIRLSWVPTSGGYRTFCRFVIRSLAFCTVLPFLFLLYSQIGGINWITGLLIACFFGLLYAVLTIAPEKSTVRVSNSYRRNYYPSTRVSNSYRRNYPSRTKYFFSSLVIFSLPFVICLCPLIIFVYIAFLAHDFSHGSSNFNEQRLWMLSLFQIVRPYAVAAVAYPSLCIVLLVFLGINPSKRAALDPKVPERYKRYVGHIEHKISLLFLRRLGLVSPGYFYHAVSCLLLKKVGREYMFPHRFLLEYFAELNIK